MLLSQSSWIKHVRTSSKGLSPISQPQPYETTLSNNLNAYARQISAWFNNIIYIKFGFFAYSEKPKGKVRVSKQPYPYKSANGSFERSSLTFLLKLWEYRNIISLPSLAKISTILTRLQQLFKRPLATARDQNPFLTNEKAVCSSLIFTIANCSIPKGRKCQQKTTTCQSYCSIIGTTQWVWMCSGEAVESCSAVAATDVNPHSHSFQFSVQNQPYHLQHP